MISTMMIMMIFVGNPIPKVEAEHSATLRCLSESHQSQMSRLMSQLAEERERSQALMAQVAALQKGQEMGDVIITSLCMTGGQ